MTAKQLSQSEIWDDSALVDSWNEALAEYKNYHSIAAKKENVDQVLAAAEDAESAVPEAAPLTTDAGNGLPDWQPSAESQVPTHQEHEAVAAAEPTQHPTSAAVPQQRPFANGVASTMPQALMNTVQDEGLKNLMMSWYYAGYYTGLYEGQQKALASQQNGKVD